jgi:membrane-associated phospholipid phosphatase
MFLIAMGLALVGYVVYPTAPPRFMPEWGFTDTVADFVGEKTANAANLLYNPFAAMPSMHVAFALMIAIPAIMLMKRRVLKLLWALYPPAVAFVVVVTANHWWIDGAFGVLVAALSAYGAYAALARVRPEAWSWRRTPARVTA